MAGDKGRGEQGLERGATKNEGNINSKCLSWSPGHYEQLEELKRALA